MEAQQTPRLKLVLMGSQGAGKTSLMWRFIRDEFIVPRPATTICSPPGRNLVVAGMQTMVEMWDTAGQERFGDLNVQYYRNTDCAVAVFDVGARDSFEALQHWSSELESKARRTDCLPEDWEAPALVVLGNKADTEGVVSWSEAQAWARAKAAPLFLCSAQTGQGVEAAFHEAARLGLSRQLRLSKQ